MSNKAFGNKKGLKHSELKKIERLFHRRCADSEVVSLDLARELYALANELRRRIGILLTRDGHVAEVCIGSKEILYLPDLGRYRLGPGRLRRMRLIYSDLSSKHSGAVNIPHDIYTDLEKLRLDAVAGVKVEGNHVLLGIAYLKPGLESSEVHTEQIRDLASYRQEFDVLIEGLESELERTSFGSSAKHEQRALLVGVYEKGHGDPQGSMLELEELARTAGVRVAGKIVQMRNLDPRTLVGKGKLEEIVLRCLALGAEIIIFDRELRPTQWRVITNSTELKVLDRSMLILDIFAQRAKSSEGRLQVELAQLRYNLPRLVEKDTGLSRLTGGIGGRGPGETKLEIGRRRIRDRIIELERRIDKLSQDRELRGQRRVDEKIPLVAILGYTNVGKSTLFNALTQSSVLVENKLFATLDPVQRQLYIPNSLGTDNKQTDSINGSASQGRRVIISDTVGFIRDLPDELRAAFRATLEELHKASLLVHVLDASDPQIDDRLKSVQQILKELKLENIALMTVLNKCDLIQDDKLELLSREYDALTVSAGKRIGLPALLVAIGNHLGSAERKNDLLNAQDDNLES